MRYFVIRGFGVKQDRKGQAFDFDRTQRELIDPALALHRFEGGTTATELDAGSIHADMFELILHADVVVCDISVHNANVFYELGVRHSLRRKSTVLIKAASSADATPFDVGGMRYLAYDAAEPAARVQALAAAIGAGLASERQTDSPVFQFLPGLQEARPDEVCPASVVFTEAVERALAAADPERLAALAEQSRGLRYPWSGLVRVARALSQLKQHEAARAHWEALAGVNAHRLEARLALANLYERLSRGERLTDGERAEWLTRSDQALRAVLATPGLGLDPRAEALALLARNRKTVWRRAWEPAPDPGQRRERALHRSALEAFEAYREAFELDLNGAYRGLAALQMGVLLNHLAGEPGFADIFEDDAAAEAVRERLASEVPDLRRVVEAAIRRQLAVASGEERMWADVSRADLLFLTVPEPEGGAPSRRVNQAYRAAVPAGHAFARDAARSQLELFAALGVRAGIAAGAIEVLRQA